MDAFQLGEVTKSAEDRTQKINVSNAVLQWIRIPAASYISKATMPLDWVDHVIMKLVNYFEKVSKDWWRRSEDSQYLAV